MFRIIISLFFIFFFIGCEKKDAYSEIIKKLREQNITKEVVVSDNIQKDIQDINNTEDIVVEKNTTDINKTNIDKKVDIPDERFVNKEENKQENNITNLTLSTIDNKKIKLTFKKDGINFENYNNKVVILDIFTSWCPPCIECIPHLNQLQKNYKKDIQIIGILMDEDKKDNEEMLKYTKKHNIKYPISNCKENFTLANTWGGISGYPTIIIFDKNGKYFNHYNGSPPLEMLESDIKKVLRK